MRAWLLCAALAVLCGCAAHREAAKDQKQSSGTGTVDRLREARKAVESDPVNAEAHYRYGNALFDLGIFGEASAAYQEALRLEPGMAKAYTNLGLTFRRLGQLEAAAGAYEQALKHNPNDVLTLGNLRAVAELLGDSERALQCLQRMVAVTPENRDIVLELAQWLYALERFDGAAEAYTRITRQRDATAGDFYALGLCHYNLDQWDAAESAWTDGLKRDAKHPPLLRAMPVLYWSKGDFDRAWDAVSRCRRAGVTVDPAFIEQLQTDSGHHAPEAATAPR